MLNTKSSIFKSGTTVAGCALCAGVAAKLFLPLFERPYSSLPMRPYNPLNSLAAPPSMTLGLFGYSRSADPDCALELQRFFGELGDSILALRGSLYVTTSSNLLLNGPGLQARFGTNSLHLYQSVTGVAFHANFSFDEQYSKLRMLAEDASLTPEDKVILGCGKIRDHLSHVPWNVPSDVYDQYLGVIGSDALCSKGGSLWINNLPGATPNISYTLGAQVYSFSEIPGMTLGEIETRNAKLRARRYSNSVRVFGLSDHLQYWIIDNEFQKIRAYIDSVR
jgi:hypothetical protein